MHRLDELFLGLKPDAKSLLLPRQKVLDGVSMTTGPDGEITEFSFEEFRDEPVRRYFDEHVVTSDMMGVNLILWAFPLRPRGKYDCEIYRTVCRRVDFPSRVLRTSRVVVVEVVDNDDVPVAESVWSDADIKNAVEAIEKASPFACAAEWADLCQYVWREIWRDNNAVCHDLEISSPWDQILRNDLRESLNAYFWYAMGFMELDEEVKMKLAKLDEDSLLWRKMFNSYLKFEFEFIHTQSWAENLERVQKMIYEQDKLDPIFYILAGDHAPRKMKQLYRFIRETNRQNIDDLYAYARKSPRLFYYHAAKLPSLFSLKYG